MDKLSTAKQIKASRLIAAEPASLALLVAGPSGVDLRPGAERVPSAASNSSSVPARIGLPGGQLTLVIGAEAPVRTPAEFLLRFRWEVTGGDQVGDVELTGVGELQMGYLSRRETLAELTLTLVPPRAPERAAAIAAMGEGFLDNLAAVAQARSRAA